MYSPLISFFLASRPLPVWCVLFLKCASLYPDYVLPGGLLGKICLSRREKAWFVELADFWGVNTQTIADFRLPIGSLSTELGRNVCNWLCKPVWVASAHPWLHLSAWITNLPGSLLWLQPAGHTQDTVCISLPLPFCTLTYFFISTSVSSSMKTGITVFPLSFWHIAQCLAHSFYLIRVYRMSKSSFPLLK